MMKIIIVDDEPLARERLRALVDEIGIGKVVAEVDNGKDAIENARVHQPEVVLLDIRMPGMDGMQTAVQLASLYPVPAIIFTTAYSEHAWEAFEHQAVDYLLKPIRKDRLEQALKRAYNFVYSQQLTPLATPTVRTHIRYVLRGEVHLAPVNQICYFFAHHKYVMLYWKEKNKIKEVPITEALKDLEEEFAGQFLRIHRNALIAITQIDGFRKENDGRSYVLLKDCLQPLEVSRRHLKPLKQLLNDMRISVG